MANSSYPFRHDPRALSRGLYDRAKGLWGVAYALQLGVFGVGITLVFFAASHWVGILLAAALCLSVASEIVLLRFEAAKGIAEELLRKLDLRDSFGWGLDEAEMRDFLARSPSRLTEGLTTEDLGERYFASGQSIGPERALENVQESAWWSKHLASRMVLWCAGAALVLLIGPIAVLVASILATADPEKLSLITQVAVSVLMAGFTFGLLRLAFAYYSFSRESDRAVVRAESASRRLLAEGSVSLERALRVVQEYHLARTVAPPIPSWLWRRNQDRLNRLWEQYRPGP